MSSEIAIRNIQNPDLFLRSYLEEWFPGPIPWFHKGIIAILTRRCAFLERASKEELDKITRHFVWKANPFDVESPEVPIFRFVDGHMTMSVRRYTVIMMPRGYSKTTLFNGTNLYKIVHLLSKFILYGSESGSHATMQLGNIKEQLESNELILKTYGNLVGPKWTQDDIETSTGVKVVARGRGGQIRGLLRGSQRPDNIGLDDVEDEESVLTDAQRQKARQWIMRSVMPALPRQSQTATFTMLGTLLHNDAAMMTLAKDPRVTFVRFAAVDRDGDALWDAHMSLDQLEAEKAAYSLAGDLSGFYLEYMSELSSIETAKFKNIPHGTLQSGEAYVSLALAVDPAISPAPGADFFVIAVVAMTNKGRFIVLDAEGGKGILPREQIDRIFSMYKKWFKATNIRPIVGVEAISYQVALVHLLREEMFRQPKADRVYFEVIPIKHANKDGKQQSKIKRVEGVLQPRYANGHIFHAEVFPELEMQLRDWPNGKKDFPDAVAMAITLLDPFAANAAEDGGESLAKDAYPEDDDIAIGGAP